MYFSLYILKGFGNFYYYTKPFKFETTTNAFGEKRFEYDSVMIPGNKEIAQGVATAFANAWEGTNERRNVPHGASDPVSYEDIGDGDKMVDFDQEYKYGRYYKKETFPMLKGKNPFKNQAIQTRPTYYTAQIVLREPTGGKRRRKTYRRAPKKKGRKTRGNIGSSRNHSRQA